MKRLLVAILLACAGYAAVACTPAATPQPYTDSQGNYCEPYDNPEPGDVGYYDGNLFFCEKDDGD